MLPRILFAIENDINLSTIIAGITIGFGVVFSKWLETRATNKRSDQESVFKQQRSMIDDLVKRVKSLENNLNEAKEEIRDLTTKNEMCLGEHRKNQEEITSLRAEVAQLRNGGDHNRHRF